jgi:predicted HicB family RNase H-like nuclease
VPFIWARLPGEWALASYRRKCQHRNDIRDALDLKARIAVNRVPWDRKIQDMFLAMNWKEPEMSEVAQLPYQEERKQEAFRVATELFRQEPDWVTFFREVLGVGGVVRRLFNSQEEMNVFEQSAEYTDIQQMVAKLRERGGVHFDGKEPTRVITVRLPKSLHESLKTEAHDRKTSMNQLCISKLLQVINEELQAQEAINGE